MSTGLAVAIVWAVLAVVVPLAYCRIRRVMNAELERNRRRQIARNVHDVGPDALRLLQDLDDHLDRYFAELSPLFEQLGPPPTTDHTTEGDQ